MDSSAVWFSSDATAISKNDVLSNTNRDYVVIESGAYIEVEFSADSSLSDGQGIYIAEGFTKGTVSSTTNTVKKIDPQYVNMAMTRADVYNDANATIASVNDIVQPRTYLVCARNAVFKVKLKLLIDLHAPWAAIPLVSLFFYQQ